MQRRNLVTQLAAALLFFVVAYAASLALPAGVPPARAGLLGETDPMPEPGQWRIRTTAFYTPYFLTLINLATGSAPPQYTVSLKDCKDPPSKDEADRCPPKVTDRPIESRHHAQVAAVAEAGLAPGMALRLAVPFDYVQQYSSNSKDLPPYMKSPTAIGVGDISIGLERSLYAYPGGNMHLTAAARIPPMAPALGNEIIRPCITDLAGKSKDCVVFMAAPSADLSLAFNQALYADLLHSSARVAVNYPFRRSGVEDATTWRGLRFDFGAGLEVRPLPGLGLELNAIGQWANPAEQIEAGTFDHILVSTTGHVRIDLAPAISLRVADGMVLRASAASPVIQSGYQRDFPLLAGTLGLTVEL
ncbi:MAG: hypothetical protein FJZ01_04735 [Candidatus Sericytochromatia bacterium]|nr:hypothetical protein [Candidatus Tanganyikabacteria bacterium]